MDKKNLIPFLKSHYLFQGLTDSEIREIAEVSEVRSIEKGQNVVVEGERNLNVYLLIHGHVEVLKKSLKAGGEQQQIAILGPGEIIGEMSFIDSSPTSATVRTLEDSSLLVLSTTNELGKKHLQQASHNISKNLTQRLRQTDEVVAKALQSELEGAKIRLEMGVFLFGILVILAAWIISLSFLNALTHEGESTSFVTFPMLAAALAIWFFHLKTSIYPPEFYGLTTKNWKRNVVKAILFTIPLLFLSFIVKWVIVKTIPSFSDQPLVLWDLANPLSRLSLHAQWAMTFFYILLVPLQELFARGSLQSSLSAFFTLRHKNFWSILISNFLFAAFHTHISPFYAIASFIGGCLWGAIYARQKSLIGPIVSHILVGLVSLGFFGLAGILTSM
jgi:CRP-like cAMP-binding protein